MTSGEDWRARFEREAAEQADHYALIDRMWTESDLPHSIWKTPDWESGYDLLIDWFERRSKGLDWPSGETPRERNYGWPSRPSSGEREFRPSYDATWGHEVHILSHMLHREGGHSPRHADIEEEGVRLILQWWDERFRK